MRWVSPFIYKMQQWHSASARLREWEIIIFSLELGPCKLSPGRNNRATSNGSKSCTTSDTANTIPMNATTKSSLKSATMRSDLFARCTHIYYCFLLHLPFSFSGDEREFARHFSQCALNTLRIDTSDFRMHRFMSKRTIWVEAVGSREKLFVKNNNNNNSNCNQLNSTTRLRNVCAALHLLYALSSAYTH